MLLSRALLGTVRRRRTRPFCFCRVGACALLFVSAAAERDVDKTIIVHARVCGLLIDVIFFFFASCFCFVLFLVLFDLTHLRTHATLCARFLLAFGCET